VLRGGTGVLVPLVFEFFDYFLDVMDHVVCVLGGGLKFIYGQDVGIDDFCEREDYGCSDTTCGNPEDYECQANSPDTALYLGVYVRVRWWCWAYVDASFIWHCLETYWTKRKLYYLT
jgi:hypothetical protein